MDNSKYTQELNQELQLSSTQQNELYAAQQVEQGTLKASSKTAKSSTAEYLERMDNSSYEDEY